LAKEIDQKSLEYEQRTKHYEQKIQRIEKQWQQEVSSIKLSHLERTKQLEMEIETI